MEPPESLEGGTRLGFGDIGPPHGPRHGRHQVAEKRSRPRQADLVEPAERRPVHEGERSEKQGQAEDCCPSRRTASPAPLPGDATAEESEEAPEEHEGESATAAAAKLEDEVGRIHGASGIVHKETGEAKGNSARHTLTMARRIKRTGLHIRGARGHPVVRGALIRYARWLRVHYEFPIRAPVYLSPQKLIKTLGGRLVTASFFAPWARDVEPYIRASTGDYAELRRLCGGRDNALASYITSLSHEVVHYRQWLDTGSIWERGVVTEARRMLRRYEQTTARP